MGRAGKERGLSDRKSKAKKAGETFADTRTRLTSIAACTFAATTSHQSNNKCSIYSES
jgi:hypothetical protein